MKTHVLVATAYLFVLSPLGCDPGAGDPETEQSNVSEQCGMELRTDRSLYFNDTAALRSEDPDSPFGLRRTLEAIIATSGSTDRTPEQLLDGLLDEFFLLGRNVDQPYSASVPTPGATPLPVRVDGLRLEVLLSARKLLNPDSRSFMRPVALFNRLDLAPESADTCGEYRIVYAKRNDGGLLASALNRFLLIFEAKLPNPTPELGIEGCRAVAELWADLSKRNPGEAAAELEQFFYRGIDGFGPVVTFDNYRDGGQVRSNHFVTPIWQLREWTTQRDPAGRAAFAMEPLNNTPLVEYYDAGNPYSLLARVTRRRFDELRQAFRVDFLDSQIANLASPERAGLPVDAFHIANAIAAAPRPAFEDYQSNSQGRSDQPIRNVARDFKRDIEARSSALGLTADHILNRAGAMTCGGCHQFSGGVEIAAGITWPERDAAFSFVHVREDGALSPTLHATFLPHRQTALEAFLCAASPAAPPSRARTRSALTRAPLPTH